MDNQVTEVAFLEATLVMNDGDLALKIPRRDYLDQKGRVVREALLEIDEIVSGMPSFFWRVVDSNFRSGVYQTLEVKRTLFGNVLLKWFDEPKPAARLSVNEYRELSSYLA